ncbi:hypothetical protein MMC34_002561 [Xylographa carneopallida]|nr:hypothetical protein [Xylographa carneopallida]
MSASGADVTRTSLISNPRESKRGACDRCRGQKLRCLREDQSQDSTCVRCFKAGAICSFGTPKRAGRPRGSSSYSPQERRANGGGNPKHGGTSSRSSAHTSGHGILFESKMDGGLHQNSSGGWDDGCFVRENTAEEESGGETEDTIPGHAMSPSSLFDTSKLLGDFPAVAGSSTAALPWPDETFSSFYNDNAGDASGLESFGPKYSWAFQHYHAGPVDMQMLTASPIDSDGLNAYTAAEPSLPTNVQPSQSSNEAMDLDLPSALIQPTKTPNPRQTNARDHDKRSSAGSPAHNDSLSVQEGQRQRMQELSELAMELYTQIATHDLEQRPPTSATAAPAFQAQLVGSVLKSSTTFLALLASFARPDTTASPHTADASTRSSSVVSSPISAASASPSNDQAANSPPSPSSPHNPTDMPTILQLLTCYIRIVRLHGLMYSSMLAYTQPRPARPAQPTIPPVFPGLAVGGVPLDAFGALQVGLLLHIAVHVLGDIEAALGLPEEYCVGRRRGGGGGGVGVRGDGGEGVREGEGGDGGGGVLGASVSSGFVRCLMREGVWRGKRRVEGMREQLGLLKRVLKGVAGGA